MNILKPLTVNFEHHLHDDFLKRITKSNNDKALNFVKQYSVIANGVLCKECNEIKPVYCYPQNKNHKHGVCFTKCAKCFNNSRCPYARLLTSVKIISKTRNDPPPEITVGDLKELFKQQNGFCPVRNEKMKERHGDGDPFNMTLGRKNNSIHYTKDNALLICHKYQVIKGEYSVHEIRSWLNYDSTNDGFNFDPAIFNKPKTVYRKYCKVIRRGNMKSCTDCDEMLHLKSFSGKMSICKQCTNIRTINRCNTPYGFMKKIEIRAKQNAKERSLKMKRIDSSHECGDDLFTLFVDVIKEQGGRCAITGIPLVYKLNHKFAASIDRIEVSKGYVKSNLRFIITPLNTMNN